MRVKSQAFIRAADKLRTIRGKVVKYVEDEADLMEDWELQRLQAVSDELEGILKNMGFDGKTPDRPKRKR